MPVAARYVVYAVSLSVLGLFIWGYFVRLPADSLSWFPKPSAVRVPCWFEYEGDRTPKCLHVRTQNGLSVPDEKQVILPVVIFESISDEKAIDPILYLEGGPGYAALRLREFTGDMWQRHLQSNTWASNRDVVAFDYRGVGKARPSVECQPLWRAMLRAPSLTPMLIAECRRHLERSGVNLQNYGTKEIAADVVGIRRALGLREWNLWAASYGSYVAFRVAGVDAGAIRSIVMDGVLPPNIGDWRYDTPERHHEILQNIFERCRKAQACKDTYGDLTKSFSGAVEHLKRRPRNLNINLGSLGHGHISIRFTHAWFIDLLHFLMLSTEGISKIPAYVQGVEDQRWSIYEALMAQYLSSEILLRSNPMHYHAVTCNDLGPLDEEEWQRLKERYPAMADWLGVPLCDMILPGYSDGNKETSAPIGETPVLMLGGELDPVTPAAWARKASSLVRNGQLFVFPGRSHDVLASACAKKLVRKFIEDPGRAIKGRCVRGLNGSIDFNAGVSAQ